MDPCRNLSFPGHTFLENLIRIPHQTNLILTVLDVPENMTETVKSRLTGCAAKKGPLIAGF